MPGWQVNFAMWIQSNTLPTTEVGTKVFPGGLGFGSVFWASRMSLSRGHVMIPTMHDAGKVLSEVSGSSEDENWQ